MKRFLFALASSALIVQPAMAAEHAQPSTASEINGRPASG
jgi:opacity protein-like surface antigen